MTTTIPTKPTEKPEYARTTGVVTTPTEGKKDLGWENTEKPPASFMNWIHKYSYLWINYFEKNNDELVLFQLYEAGETIAADDALILKLDSGAMKVFKADNGILQGVTNFAGFATNGGNVGETIKVARIIWDGLLGLTVGDYYFIGTSGAITNSKPASNALKIGIALSATTIGIRLQPENIILPEIETDKIISVGSSLNVNTLDIDNSGNINQNNQRTRVSEAEILSGSAVGTQNTWYNMFSVGVGSFLAAHLYVSNKSTNPANYELAIYEIFYDDQFPFFKQTKRNFLGFDGIQVQLSGGNVQVRNTLVTATLEWKLFIGGQPGTITPL